MTNLKHQSTLEARAQIDSGKRLLVFPWHGWVLGGIMCLYSLAAAYDYVMSFAEAENYYRASGMTEAQINYFLNVPVWAVIGWTLSVWCGLLGSVGLLFSSRFATVLYAVSVVGSLIYILYVLILSGGREAMGVIWFMPIVITALTAALVGYCLRLEKAGILR